MTIRTAATILALAVVLPTPRVHAQAWDAATFRQAMDEWKQDNAYNDMTAAQRAEADKAADARREAQQKKADAYEECEHSAMTPAAMMAMSQAMQKRMMELAGDPDMATKAGNEQAKAMKDIVTKKCGPKVKAPGFGRMNPEPFLIYLRIRKEKGPKAAADAISLTPEEAKVFEDNLAEMAALAATQMKGGKF